MADDSFRQAVRDAWGTECLVCGRSPEEWIASNNRRQVNSLHHINGDDTDDRVANVIPLCQRCHIHVHKTDAPPYRQWHRQLPIEHRNAWNAHHKAYYEGPRLNSPQAEWFYGDAEGTPESARSHDQKSTSADAPDEADGSEVDILLRVNAEESRAVGVSGLQPWTPPLHGSSRLTQSSWSVAVSPCQAAVTPILGVVDSHLLFLPAGSR